MDIKKSTAVRLGRAAVLLSFVVLSQTAHADVVLNFVNADIDQVARAIGAAANKTIIVDPRVKGQLNLVSERPVSSEQALKTLEASLRMQGFALLNDHGVLKVVPEADAKLQGVPTFVGNAPQARGDQIVTQVFQLRNESANNLLPVLRPLVSPNNSVAAYPGNNTLVVTDYADNVRRIASIIAGVDSAAGMDVEVVPLANANAVDVAAVAAKLLDPGMIGNTDATLKVNVNADSRINAVILRASNPQRLKMAKALVAKLDAPTREPGNIHVVPLRNADATTLARTLRSMMGQGSGTSGTQGGALPGGNQSSTSNGLGTGSNGSSSSNGSLGGSSTPLPSGGIGGSNSGFGGNGMSNASSGLTGSGTNGSQGNDASGGDQSGGMITADAATNSLVITAPEPVYRNLRNVIEQLDARRVQIYIESLIMEVSTTRTGALGVQWQGGVTSSSGNNILYGNSNVTAGSLNSIVDLTTAGVAYSTGATGATIPTLANGLNIGLLHRFGSILGVGGLLQAVSTNSDVNVLSTPNLITLDNQEARILVGQNIPIPSGSYATATTSATNPTTFNTYSRTDVGVMLHVKPQVSQNGTIKLAIYQEDSSVDASTASQAGGYTINKRALQSTVLCDDGAIIALGGLIGDDYRNANSKVPLLGDLPLIGSLFRSETKSRNKRNLMVFLRPVILRDAQISEQVSLSRYDYMRMRAENYQSDNRLIKDGTVPVPSPAASVSPQTVPFGSFNPAVPSPLTAPVQSAPVQAPPVATAPLAPGSAPVIGPDLTGSRP
ncbi:type II secretion system secretin GspD [Chitinasiproducens palmae]|uniref:Type II secretion system protein D (GspD) n=1 Tax=Chitinasiproducens palmae TaxID=1770053 RepID=A0A1H2PQ64_9BURK|nr:type II secretion system secretin GspD [Chitinasiproducens palmae]SDV48492.1 type II secretion system protein D (GspD) [Chitinasiproducens palmae]